jgi:hypothetical protein
MTNYTPTADSHEDSDREPRGWYGMIAFATFVLLLLGVFHVIGGFVSLFEDEVYSVPSDGLVVTVDYTLWGLAHMALGVGMVFAAYALFWGRTWGRVVAVVMAMVGAVTNLAFLEAAPVWYTVMIVLDILVIYAVTVHGGDRGEY